MGQLPLFGHGRAPSIDAGFTSLERIALDHGAWIDVARGWLSGHGALFDWLHDHVAWKAESRVMYERTVEVPRRYATLDEPRRGARSTAAASRPTGERHRRGGSKWWRAASPGFAGKTSRNASSG